MRTLARISLSSSHCDYLFAHPHSPHSQPTCLPPSPASCFIPSLSSLLPYRRRWPRIASSPVCEPPSPQHHPRRPPHRAATASPPGHGESLFITALPTSCSPYSACLDPTQRAPSSALRAAPSSSSQRPAPASSTTSIHATNGGYGYRNRNRHNYDTNRGNREPLVHICPAISPFRLSPSQGVLGEGALFPAVGVVVGVCPRRYCTEDRRLSPHSPAEQPPLQSRFFAGEAQFQHSQHSPPC